MTAQAIWLFDCECVLCSRSVQYTLRHEKSASIMFVAIQSQEGRALAQQHGLDPDDPTTFLLIENGHVLERSDAVIALLDHLKGPARLLKLTKIIPTALRDAAYTLIARNRYRIFGRTDTCIMPSEEQKHRFTLR